MTVEKIELNSFRILVGGGLNGPDVLDKIEKLGKMNLEEQKILARATKQFVLPSVRQQNTVPVDF